MVERILQDGKSREDLEEKYKQTYVTFNKEEQKIKVEKGSKRMRLATGEAFPAIQAQTGCRGHPEAHVAN